MHIVGVGASAGGLEALESFFRAVPEDSGLAYVVLQHFAPDHRTLMVELLTRQTALPVALADDGLVPEPNHIYVLAPGKHLGLTESGRFATTPRPGGPVSVIDAFFIAGASALGSSFAAVVLSGTGSDGTVGAEAVRTAGGIVAVQDPSTARFDGMPRSVLSVLRPDAVAAPEELPRALLGLLTGPRPTPSQAPFDLIVEMLRERTKIDFSSYKRATVNRRIERRMKALRVRTIEDYSDVLARDAAEVEALGKDLLISVTQFFRDAEAFEVFREAIYRLVDEAEPGATIRVWSVGCATGEETYSVALLFFTHPRWAEKALELRLFATDIDRDALERASAGAYAADVIDSLGKYARFFNPDETGVFVVDRKVRQSILFSFHDIVMDTPFTKIDALLCRNVLIYFDQPLQRRVIEKFQFSLREGGVLFLGASEVLPPDAGFDVIDSKQRIFRRQAGRRALEMPHLVPVGRRSSPSLSPHDQLVRAAQEELLSRSRAAAFLLSSNFVLVHLLANPLGLVRLEPGSPSLQVHDLLPRALGALLMMALPKVQREGTMVRYSGIDAGRPADPSTFTLEVRPLRDGKTGTLAFLVEVIQDELATGVPREASTGMTDIENELQYTRESLHSVVDQLETANEELQATNEELIASNEELQSTNEELQSMNEELITINAEYQAKISELNALSTDLDQLLASTSISTIFLDRALRIRRFSVGNGRLLHLLPSDMGRPLTAFAFAVPPVVAAAERAAAGERPDELTITDDEGREHLVRARQSGDGVVVTYIEVTALREAQRNMQHVIDALPNETCVIDARGVITYVNRAWRRFAELNGGDLDRCGVGANYLEVSSAGGAVAADMVRGLERLLAEAGPIDDDSHFTFEYPCDAPDQARWYSLFAARVATGGAVLSHVDVTAPRAALAQSERVRRQLEARLSAVPDALLVVEGDVVVEANAAATQLLGASPKNRPFASLFREASQVALRDLVDGAVLHWTRTDEPGGAVELRTGRTPVGLVFTVRDDSLLRARALAREEELRHDSLESLGRLAGGVAHDINNLLAQIVSIAELVRAHPDLPAEVQTDLQLILSASGQGAATVRSLLAFARGKPGAPRVRVNLRELAAQVAALVGRTDARVVVDASDDVYVDVDQSAISQAVLNLLRNALDPNVLASHVRVRVGSEGEFAVLRVTDDGVGMTEDVRRRALEPFFTTKETGTGLGLSSAFGTLEEHGGTIGIESTSKAGTTVCLRLPRADRVEEPSQRTVLVVDDEPIITRTLQRWLGRPNAEPKFRVVTANSPSDALALIEQGMRPTLIVCDIVMPGTPGPVLINQIERKLGPLPVVFITGFARSEVPPELAARPSTRIVEKPFPLERLWTEMLAVLQSPPQTALVPQDASAHRSTNQIESRDA